MKRTDGYEDVDSRRNTRGLVCGVRRRSVVAGVAGAVSVCMLAACGGAGAGSDVGSDRHTIDFRLDWIFQGPNDGFVVAEKKGFYDAAGLDVNVKSGTGSATTAKLVSNGSADMGFSDGYVVAQYRAKGAPLKMVGSIYRSNPNGIISLPSAHIQTPGDLVGKKVGIPSGASQAQQWPVFTKGCKLTGVAVANISASSEVQALLQHRVDAIAGYVQGLAPGVKIKGHKTPRVLPYTACGVKAVSNGIIATDSYIKENPGVVRAFVKASVKGFLYARQHPKEAVKIVQDFDPTVNPKVTLSEMRYSWRTWVPPNTAGKPLGWMSREDWQETLKLVRHQGGGGRPVTANSVFTNKYVPKGSQFVPPQN